MVILTLDTTTRAGSCAVWRGDGIVDELVGNPDFTHAHRLPNDLAKVLANHRLRLHDVTLYAIASGPGSIPGLRTGIATMQSLAQVHDRLIVPISSLEALAYCAARVAATRAVPGAYIGAWLDGYRGEVFGALYRVQRAATLIESTDPRAGEPPPERYPASVVPLPAIPPKQFMSLPLLEQIVEPAVGTPEVMTTTWAQALTVQAQASGGPPPSLLVIGDAVRSHREVLESQLARVELLDYVPIAGMIAELAAREPERGVMPHAVTPVSLRQLAASTPERVRVAGHGYSRN